MNNSANKQASQITNDTTKLKKLKINQDAAIQNIVKEFINILKARTQDSIKLRNLSSLTLNVINDYTYYKDGVKNTQNKFKILLSKSNKNLLSSFSLGQNKKQQQKSFIYFVAQSYNKIHIPIIQPNQKFKILSDCWQSYWVLFRMFFTTIRLFFYSTNIIASIGLIQTSTLMVINISFIFDMFLSLHTGYYEKGNIITDRKKIAIRYLKSTFISDVLAQIPMIMQYYVEKDSNKNIILIAFFAELLIFLKCFSLKQVFNRLERVVTEHEKGAAWFPLFRLCVNVALQAHIVACLYYLVAVYQTYLWEEDKTWVNYVDNIDVHDDSWFLKYINAIYWAFSTMVSNVVFVPQTKTEIVFCILMITLMTGIFGYVLNTIGQILTDISQKSKAIKNERENVNRFLKQKKISEKLRERVTLYLDYIHQQEKTKNQAEEDQILSRMSDQLKKEILQEMNQNNVQKFKIIAKNFSQQTICETMQIIQESVFSAGDIIYQQLKKEDVEENHKFLEQNSIFFLKQGEVQLFKQCSNSQNTKKVITYKPGDIFGTQEFFTGNRKNYIVQCSVACTVYFIKRSDFIKQIKKISQDYEIFQMIKDQFVQQIYSQYYQDNCQLCLNQQHQEIDCDQIQFNTNTKNIYLLNKNLKEVLQKRYQFQRTGFISTYAISEIDIVQESQSEFAKDNTEIILKYLEVYDITHKEALNNTSLINSQSYASQDMGLIHIKHQQITKLQQQQQQIRDKISTQLSSGPLIQEEQNTDHLCLEIPNQIFKNNTLSSQNLNVNLQSQNIKKSRKFSISQLPIQIFASSNCRKSSIVQLQTMSKYQAFQQANNLIEQNTLQLQDEIKNQQYNEQFQQINYEDQFIFDKMQNFDFYFPHNNLSNLYQTKTLEHYFLKRKMEKLQNQTTLQDLRIGKQNSEFQNMLKLNLQKDQSLIQEGQNSKLKKKNSPYQERLQSINFNNQSNKSSISIFRSTKGMQRKTYFQSEIQFDSKQSNNLEFSFQNNLNTFNKKKLEKIKQSNSLDQLSSNSDNSNSFNSDGNIDTSKVQQDTINEK